MARTYGTFSPKNLGFHLLAGFPRDRSGTVAVWPCAGYLLRDGPSFNDRFGLECLSGRTGGVVGDESEETVLEQELRRVVDSGERDAGPLRNVQQRVPPI